MSIINATPLLAAAGGDYQISRSVRLRSSASAYFNRTPASAGNRTTWTWSGWVKRGTLGAVNRIFSADDGTASTDQDYNSFLFNSSDQLVFGGNLTTFRVTTAVYRDPSAWYHIVFATDTTQATAANRFKLYVNGSEVTAFGTSNNPSQNTDLAVNATIGHFVGSIASGSYFDGYLTEVNFIDGQALTPSSFGETDSITGVWKPKKYAGTYGTNGFFLNFSDNSAATAAAIGKDYSGNGNNWTPNNISVTAGVTYDSMLDVPTPYADGGNGRGNYCVLNPVFKQTGNTNTTFGVMATPSDGNLSAVMGAGTNVYATISPYTTLGKWYVECTAASVTSDLWIGIMSGDGNVNRASYYSKTSGVVIDNVSKSTPGFLAGETIGIAVDSVAQTIQFYRAGSAQGSTYVYTGSWSYDEFFFCYTNSGATVYWNFGQRPFAYTPPTGFKALNTQNLPEPTIKKGNQYFDVVTRAGTGSAVSVSSLSFQPNAILTKLRNTAYNWYWADSERGVSKTLSTDTTAAEQTPSPALFTSFNSDGYTLGTSTGSNGSTYTYVDYVWKESPSAGFDIVTYVGTGSGTTVSHSLGVAPKMMIVKQRSASGNYFVVWMSGVTSTTQSLWLGATNAILSTPNYWNSTAPTSSVFSVGNDSATNGSGSTYVAYLFAEVAGFSKAFSYTGNGSADGPFVFCGFKPAFIMIKRTDTTGNWTIHDNRRLGYNGSSASKELYPNLSNAEGSDSMDQLSNGFKLRDTYADVNASGGTYIGFAFAESPFKNSLAR